MAVMNRLRYPQKFVLISALFAIPIAFMMYQWLTELGSRLDFADRERSGLEYVMALRQVLEPLERTRGLRLLAETGDTAARAQLDDEHAKIVRAVGLMDSVNARLGEELQVGEPVAAAPASGRPSLGGAGDAADPDAPADRSGRRHVEPEPRLRPGQLLADDGRDHALAGAGRLPHGHRRR